MSDGNGDNFDDEPTKAKRSPLHIDAPELPESDEEEETTGEHGVSDAANVDAAFDALAGDEGGVPDEEDAETKIHDDPAGDPAEESAAPPESAPADDGSRLVSIVESLLFASDKPLGLQQLAQLLGESDVGKVRAAIAAVEDQYRTRGIQLQSVAGGWQFRTNAENASWVQRLLAQKPVRLTRAQLETLAIVAYRQPITRPEIDDIRGVDSGGTLKTLMDRSLLRILGKKEEPGRPMLYGSTREFLEFFNLSDLKDLPTLREFHELSEEHQAQVAALESVAPEGSVEPEEAPQPPPLQRVELQAPPEDTAELDEIDRLISTADTGGKPEQADPNKQPTDEK